MVLNMGQMTELRKVYDRKLRTTAEMTGALATTRVGQLWIALFDGDEALVTWNPHDWGGVDLDPLILRVEQAVARLGREVNDTKKWSGRIEWKIRAHDAPDGLAKALTARGYTREATEAVMLGRIDEILALLGEMPADLRVRQIKDGPRAKEDMETFLHVQAAAFAEPPAGPEKTAEYLRLLHDYATVPGSGFWLAEIPATNAEKETWTAVGTGRAERVPGTQIVGLWSGGVVPTCRGRGTYTALLLARLQAGRQAGARWVYSDSSPMSAPIHAPPRPNPGHRNPPLHPPPEPKETIGTAR